MLGFDNGLWTLVLWTFCEAFAADVWDPDGSLLEFLVAPTAGVDLCNITRLLPACMTDTFGVWEGDNSSSIVSEMSWLMLAKVVAAKRSLCFLELTNRACAIEELKSSKGDDLTVTSEIWTGSSSTEVLSEGKGWRSSVLGGGGGGLSLSSFSHQLPSSSLLLYVEMVEADSVSLSWPSCLRALAFLVEPPSVVVLWCYAFMYMVKDVIVGHPPTHTTCTYKHDMTWSYTWISSGHFPEGYTCITWFLAVRAHLIRWGLLCTCSRSWGIRRSEIERNING